MVVAAPVATNNVDETRAALTPHRVGAASSKAYGSLRRCTLGRRPSAAAQRLFLFGRSKSQHRNTGGQQDGSDSQQYHVDSCAR